MTTETDKRTILQTEVLYLDDFAKIACDTCANYIELEWLQHPTTEAFRKCFYRAVELSIELGTENWLSDARAIHYIDFANQNWIIEHILPMLPKTKVKKFARITSLESIALMDTGRIYCSLEEIAQKTRNLALADFTTREDALDWLLAKV